MIAIIQRITKIAIFANEFQVPSVLECALMAQYSKKSD